MAFDPNDLSLENATGNVYLWSYVTTDNLATVNGSSYWHPATGLLRPGDQVAVTASDGKFWGFADPVGGITAMGVINKADVSTFHLP